MITQDTDIDTGMSVTYMVGITQLLIIEIPHSSTTNRQVGARAPSIAETLLTQVDLRPTSTDSESTPKIPQNPVRIWADFRDDPDFPPPNHGFRQ